MMENSFELLSVSLGGVSRAESDASLNDESLHRSKMKFQEIFPVFALLGEFVEPPSLYDVSSSGVQLVCKYLKGYHEDNLDHLMKRMHTTSPLAHPLPLFASLPLALYSLSFL